jgi:hypothetical protein
VEPNWDYEFQAKNWRHYMENRYLPIGLLKLGSLHRKLGNTVELVRGDALPLKKPELVLITSLFTYWWNPVWESVTKFKNLYPNAKVVVGGIYASIMPDHCKQSGCDEVHTGLLEEAEKLIPAYDLVPKCSFCVIHASRGCVRKCEFCYSHKIEPKFKPKRSIKQEIVKSNVSFLDNNLLTNPYIEVILKELIEKKVNSSWCLSGVDAAFVTKEIADLMYEANFRDIRISFDRADEEGACKRAIRYLEEAGYQRKKIGVFILYNFEDSFEEVEKRRLIIKNWGAHIIKQRYIPIPSLTQTYLHPKWTEEECNQFAINCRERLKD